MTKAELADSQRAYLEPRCGHTWKFDDKGVVRCADCGRKQGKNAPWRCPKKQKPNRWRMHWQRGSYAPPAQNCEHCRTFAGTPRQLDGHMRTEHAAFWIAARLAELEREAKHVSRQDVRSWQYHPVAVEYRKLLREWWALGPIPKGALELSPTRNRMLSALSMPSTSKAEGQLDLMFGERRKVVGDGYSVPREKAQEWRRINGFDPLPMVAA